jgi:hypothetical protein
LRGGVLHLAQVVGRQIEVNGGQVFLEAVQLSGAGDGHNPGLLGQQPG